MAERRPTLSVCMLTADPGARVAATLAMLRPVAHEIVVAADARADAEWLREYAAVADRVFRVEFDRVERHLGWLHAQCSGDWVLRLDGDEVASPALIDSLPDLVADRRVMQYLLPRRWLYPDARHWLADVPWWPDYQLRLVRNDGLLRFTGAYHTSAVPVLPARYLETPIYHLDLLLKGETARREKASAYAALHDPIEAPGGGELNASFYVPEDRPGAVTEAVPEPDAAAVATVLDAPPPARAALPETPVVSLAESDRHLAGVTFAESAYAAGAEPLEPRVRMRPGERRAVHVRFANRGAAVWPWDAELGPAVRASYRIRNERGTIVVGDGPRTPFPSDVAPGETCIVPLDTVAPVLPGRYRIEPDVVHEGVRWLGCEASVELEVETPDGWEPALPRGPGRRLVKWPRRAGEIPRVVHRVWIGGSELPEEARRYEETWRRHHPGWEFPVWDDAGVRSLVPEDAIARCRSASEVSNLARYAILAEVGGVYIDTDVECLRPLSALLDGVQAFAGWETEHRLATALIGSVPGHHVFRDLAALSRLTAGMSMNNVESTGPGLLTLLAADAPDVTRFPPGHFYPYLWYERDRAGEDFPEAYAVHHWSESWVTGS